MAYCDNVYPGDFGILLWGDTKLNERRLAEAILVCEEVGLDLGLPDSLTVYYQRRWPHCVICGKYLG